MRYVGQTSGDIWKRWENHVSSKAFSAGRLYDWWRSEEAAGFAVKLNILKRDAVRNVDEAAEIEKARADGAPLLNVRVGGDTADSADRKAKSAKTARQSARNRYWNRAICGETRQHHVAVGKLMLGYMLGK